MANENVDLAANTDFAQVEADDQRINLTRFRLFFPEKRQFSQERSSVFNFGFSRDSRRIGLAPNGEPLRIYGSVRSTSSIATEWNPSSHLEVGSEYEYNNIRKSKITVSN